MNKTLKTIVWAGIGAAALSAANSVVFARAKALGNTLEGEGRFWSGPQGDIFYARQGKGTPVVLLHGFYTGASSYEWRRNFDVLSEHYNVYAPDWLGFGLSDKPRLRYTDTVYLEQLTAFLKDVVKQPCILIASSLAAAYAIRIAQQSPHAVQSLILICPSGFHSLGQKPDLKSQMSYQLLHSPILGTTFYNTLASQASLRYYLMNQVYFDPSFADDQMIDHYSTTTHQYGSQNAVPSFISGFLDHNISDVFPFLSQKTIRLIWGREARMAPLSDAEPFLSANARAELTVFDKSGLLPHDEQAQAFNRLVIEIINADVAAHKRPRARKTQSERTEPLSEGE